VYYLYNVRKTVIIVCFFATFIAFANTALAQCAMCTKTAQQLGEKPAKGLNQGILYLMFTPFFIAGIIGYRWWKSNKDPG
jgi:hypothetical protein